MQTIWNCPHCGFENTDDPDETVLPLCGGCYEQVFWSEITAAQQSVQPTAAGGSDSSENSESGG